MTLVPEDIQAYKQQCTSNKVFGGITDRVCFCILNYYNPSDRVMQMSVEISIESLAKGIYMRREITPRFVSTDAWRTLWTNMPLGRSATIDFAFPVLVLLPGSIRAEPQVILAVCTYHTSASNQPSEEPSGIGKLPHIRWLYKH